MPDEVPPEVESRVRHVLDHLDSAVGLAARHQLQRVLVRHQRVFGAVDDQERALHLLAVLLILKGLAYHRLRAPTIQISGYPLQREEGTEQRGAVGRILLR